MKYIDSWLKGLGLDYITPKLKANGITTPKKLATLTLRDMFEFGKYYCKVVVAVNITLTIEFTLKIIMNSTLSIKVSRTLKI